jgi:hypothetical protein
VIVPVINFGELTIPRGDMGFLNRYESNQGMNRQGEVPVDKTKKPTVKQLLEGAEPWLTY